MTNNLRVAAIQMASTEDKADNLATAERLIADAVAQGAEFVVLPEVFACRGRRPVMIENAEPVPGPTSERLAAIAAEYRITLCAGTFFEASDTPGKAWNTSVTFSPDGRLLSRYRKIHLFDISLKGQVEVSESAHTVAGADLVCTEAAGTRIGQTICYDLRFPELFRQLTVQGAEIIVVPSAFTRTTGAAHWEILLRARAIENQVFIIAPDQAGTATNGIAAYGHSLIIDPWGRVLATAGGEDEAVIVADLDGAEQARIRQQLPALQHRRLP